MQTLLLDSTQENINKAGEILRNGGLVGMPTETVYGLAADALNGKAVAKIFKAKGRPMDNPLIVHIAEFGDIEKFGLVAEIPQKAKILAEKFMPGPLTIIMKKSEIIPDEVSAGLETVAIRCPSHPVARALIKAANTPLMPHMTAIFLSFSSNFSHFPIWVPMLPPICSAAPSRPAEPPPKCVRSVPAKTAGAVAKLISVFE